MKLLALPIVVLIGLATAAPAAPECPGSETAVPGTNEQVPVPKEFLSEETSILFIEKAEKGKSFVCNPVAKGQDKVQCGLINTSNPTGDKTVQKQLLPICDTHQGCFDCRFVSDPKDWKLFDQKSTTGVFEVSCKLRKKE